MFVNEYVLNGQAHGEVGQSMGNVYWEPGIKRPFFDSRGERCVLVKNGMVFNHKTGNYEPKYVKQRIADLAARGIFDPVFNATSLRKEEWILLDQVILRAARLRLRAWSDLAASSSFGGFNGMAKSVLEHETMSDPGEAVVDMDGLTAGRTDSPLFQLQGLPLPITHSDFWFSKRRLAESQNTGTPLDTTMGEAAGRRVAEKVEQTLIGTVTGFTGAPAAVSSGYGRTPATVYGYTNFPARLQYTSVTAPTGSNAASTLADVLAMRDLLINNRFYGPFMLYHSTDWDHYLDNDYILTGGNVATQTLRNRLKAIPDIIDVRRLDFLASATNPFTFLMVQMTSDVARAVTGMDITTMQWESVGGLRINFKVMAIMAPQLRADFNGRCGICTGTTH